MRLGVALWLHMQYIKGGCFMRTRTAIAIIVGIISVMLMGYSSSGSAQVSVNIGVGLPIPRLVIPAPPPVAVIPGTYVYFAPEVEADLFFYHGYWYRPHHGYRARGYNGPWNNIEGARVPRAMRHLPPDYRHTAQRHERIRYVDVKKNWKTWEEKKHWDRHGYRDQAPDVRGGGRWENNDDRHRGKGKHDR
jgi:hypothetical protein